MRPQRPIALLSPLSGLSPEELGGAILLGAAAVFIALQPGAVTRLVASPPPPTAVPESVPPTLVVQNEPEPRRVRAMRDAPQTVRLYADDCAERWWYTVVSGRQALVVRLPTVPRPLVPAEARRR